MRSEKTIVVCAVVHAFVDFSCAFLLFRRSGNTLNWAQVLLLYNFCAFALQMPLGLLADRKNQDLSLAVCGCLLTAAAYLPMPLFIAALLAGVGNAGFHVGAGRRILNLSPDRAGWLGVFVSPGALGLYVGTWMGKGETGAFLPVALLLCGAALLWWGRRQAHGEIYAVPAPKHSGSAVPIAVICLLLVVVLRSAVGMGLTIPWKGESVWAAALVCALALGKAAGGFLADRFGLVRTSAVTLAASAGLFLLSAQPLCGVAAVFLFNMTMPLTLHGAARLLPNLKGFSFGLLTFGLFLGFLPMYFGVGTLNGLWAACIAAASLGLLLPALRKAVRA